MLTFKIEVFQRYEDQTFYQGILRLNGTAILYGDPFTDRDDCRRHMMQTAYEMIGDLRRISDSCFEELDKSSSSV